METPQEIDAKKRKDRLEKLVILGKERGYLTFKELGEQLPDGIEPEQVDGIASMLNDMGIVVREG